MRVILLALIPSLFLIACGPETVYQERFTLDKAVWNYADSLEFSFEITDTTRSYNLLLDVHHRKGYPYQNLYTQIHTYFPSGKASDQLVSLELADRAGQWFGNCRGQNCRLTIPLQQAVHFNETGAYRLVLEQYLRRDSIPDVQEIGLRIVAQE